jgi:hypothetical protein
MGAPPQEAERGELAAAYVRAALRGRTLDDGDTVPAPRAFRRGTEPDDAAADDDDVPAHLNPRPRRGA